MEYYRAFKRKEILINAVTWMKPEDPLLWKSVTKEQILYSSTYMSYLMEVV